VAPVPVGGQADVFLEKHEARLIREWTAAIYLPGRGRIAIATILEFPQLRPKFFFFLSLSLSLSRSFSFIFAFPLAIIYRGTVTQENL